MAATGSPIDIASIIGLGLGLGLGLVRVRVKIHVIDNPFAFRPFAAAFFGFLNISLIAFRMLSPDPTAHL